MPRGGAKKKPDFITIVCNKIVEAPKWKCPSGAAACDCKPRDWVACVRGCTHKQQRRECTKCKNAKLCANRVIQDRNFYKTQRIDD
eukprot:1381254-Rhodomonas_salina.1